VLIRTGLFFSRPLTAQSNFSTGGMLYWVSGQFRYLTYKAILFILYQQSGNIVNLASNIRIRLIGILVVSFMRWSFTSASMLSGDKAFVWQEFWSNVGFSVLTAVLTWEGTRAVVIYYNRWSTLDKLSGKRFALEALLVLLINGITYMLTMFAVFGLSLQIDGPFVYLIFGLFDRFLYGILVAAFYELLLFMEAWKKAVQEAESLKKINVMVQLDSLKNQVKPHFLFNSLNTLTALVEKDTTAAVTFIAQLSKVYRYLLQSNEKELISLGQELEFTRAYFFLLQTRFGEGLIFNVEVADKYLTCMIPPLTLQILVENAVKHNQVSRRKPLHIGITVEEDNRLVVHNNLQPKRMAVPSNGMGLSNISAKFQLLNQPEVVILHQAMDFIVKVPILKPINN
jgi:sensor histidine kinase YesM